MIDKPMTLSIAGFDPSGCAGLLADIKTFEAFNVYGTAICTANTIQNDHNFTKANWIPIDQILAQYRSLQNRFYFDHVKIGIIENFEILNTIVDTLRYDNEHIKIIWDPVLKASAGFKFHRSVNLADIENICRKIFLITPNLDEITALVPHLQPEESGMYLSKLCNILIKGGHGEGEKSTDVLYTLQGSKTFEGIRLAGYEKRGTGCVLSAAITAGLAKGDGLIDACQKAKKYVTNFISSNHSLIGYHNYTQ